MFALRDYLVGEFLLEYRGKKVEDDPSEEDDTYTFEFTFKQKKMW